MKFADLEPRFLQHEERDGALFHVYVATIAAAHGVIFLCPACFATNQGPVGTHALIVTFNDRAVPNHLGSQSRNGGPSRWSVSGDNEHNITLQPSVDCGCWHGHVTNGEITA